MLYISFYSLYQGVGCLLWDKSEVAKLLPLRWHVFFPPFDLPGERDTLPNRPLDFKGPV